MAKERDLRRISLFIGEDQYEEISRRGLNFSWLLRDLIDDYLSEKKIILSVGDETLSLYQKIVGAAGTPDAEFEPFFKEALRAFLKNKIETMQKLEKTAFKKEDGKK
ncbi:MAG: hypothetical protein COT73_03530 [Bdellovibrio sp. CG10_big_fil_rev_8_21_14_0_10_47_8]|nr:MAG: hypothetical protein COT73_03530 [Bdellovibrio sp. CG10_big_fil_rev_8_21_14_0_10_47_8]